MFRRLFCWLAGGSVTVVWRAALKDNALVVMLASKMDVWRVLIDVGQTKGCLFEKMLGSSMVVRLALRQGYDIALSTVDR